MQTSSPATHVSWSQTVGASGGNSSCKENSEFPHFLYAVTYTVILLPGLIGNVLALWVFYGYIRETKRAVIFMINLAVADLMQVLSLPLRIFYYLHRSWPFGPGLCLFCFYLKYVNMYASVYFLVCISVRRFGFLMFPFRFTDAKRQGDVLISLAGWVAVGLACLPFPLLRLGGVDPSVAGNITGTAGSGRSPGPPNATCFVDLPTLQHLSLGQALALLGVAELLGFCAPLLVILYCSWKAALSLRQKGPVPQDLGEKKKALKMILTCAAVFLICFAPYHISFPLDFLVKANKIDGCLARRLIQTFHPVALCLASLNSCLDPALYYFTTDEFRRRLSRQDLQESLPLPTRPFSSPRGPSQNGHVQPGAG
ncbi:LOW QUALITY PROTEIN: probable G-protein coupled receptor 174 [Tachyglossus aculeatus]|uniref:LOW QUALITY PROTEIN: probable G-protein coupled receptor 174 n=1 Tax=Tachyglossus aculeatus TaxID=9261 RepID=UPI0018F67DAB|nr:LOW QUALITY PROTEIN: probable G-protein coupled receptor 174 [Tachyglossus aculeatus]